MSRLALLVICLASALPAQTWTLAADARFEVYSQGGEASARSTLAWLERLRALIVRETGITPDRLRPARVFAFATARGYAPYRPTSSAEAYYVGTEGRDYIVMALDSPRAAGIAAHEYAHLAIHTSGVEMPRWLSEGLPELFAALGGDRPEHSQALRRTPWLPLRDLLRVRDPGPASGIFYAEAWALTDMLALAPSYSGRIRPLIGALASMPPEEAIASVYGRSPDELAADLRAWLDRRKTSPPVLLPAVSPDESATVATVTPFRARLLLAQMLLDGGHVDKAEAEFRDLLAAAPANGDVHAALGTIALHRGDPVQSRDRWTRALQLGVTDDALCYRYAALAENASASPAEVRPILERAVALRPDFDDALFSLSHIEKNAGDTQAALDHLRAMRPPGPSRAFAYWSAISDALNTLNRHDEAEAAARTAASHATTAEERARAADLAFMARTELTVQLANGRVVTTRVPRRTSDWNPFVEPTDDVRSAEGSLVEIDCSGPATRFIVQTADARYRLAVPDPSRVQMRNAPPEFTCGAQSETRVRVVFASRPSPDDDGIVRGMDFR